jgi:predicted secreted protein
MNWFTGLMVFIILWWLVWFMLLPIGVKVPDEVEKGHATSAPSNPNLGVKFAATTLISGALWGVVYLVITSELISFRPS